MPTKKIQTPTEEVFDSQKMLEYACSRDPAKTAYLDKFSALVKLFETEVWFKGWKAQNDKTKHRGLRHAKPGEPLKAKKKAKGPPSGWDRLLEDNLEGEPVKEPEPFVKPVSIMSYTIASRTMITLCRGEDTLSLVADPDSDQSRAGLQGCYGTLTALRKLTNDAIDQWRKYPHTVEDDDVSLG